MPSRLACLGILLLWAFAASSLFTRDILPDLLVGPPPDNRSIAADDGQLAPTKWAIMVADDPAFKSVRSVGRAVTESTKAEDGSIKLDSRIWFDSGDLLKSTRYATYEKAQFTVESIVDIDPAGNLKAFRSIVKTDGDLTPLITLRGVYINRAIEVKAALKTGASLPDLSFTRSFAYEPKTLIQNALGPIDRMPGLSVGQRWEARVVSPLTGSIDVVKAEVTKRSEIFWNGTMTGTLEVVQKMPAPGPAVRSWVRRSDGLVLRQEIPVPFVKLLVERQP
jgi:hypothetical protein